MESRMFKEVTKTWNPVVGCTHKCSYCWARRIAKRVGKKIGCERCYQFIPHLHLERLLRVPKSGTVFLCDMGDLFCSTAHDNWIRTILGHIKRSEATFYLLTKNPARYRDFLNEISENCILGATIETDINYVVSYAPSVKDRYLAMKHPHLDGFKKFISIEPILDFTNEFSKWIQEINPKFVYVGYDNYKHRLIEPRLENTQKLIEKLEEFTEVRIKTLRRAWFE